MQVYARLMRQEAAATDANGKVDHWAARSSSLVSVRRRSDLAFSGLKCAASGSRGGCKAEAEKPASIRMRQRGAETSLARQTAQLG
jgi:hypothetical protein